MTRPVWIDTDPGIDDCLAILLALRSPEIDVLGISTVHGNTDLAQATANALRVTELAQADVPVWAGADRSVCGQLRTAEYIHGGDGLGDLLPAPATKPRPGFAVHAMAEQILSHGRPVTLIALGPLTNVALALAVYPDLAGAIERIVIMGGAIRREGNTTPSAEFNTYCDPEAAARVVASGVPQLWVPLDVTMQAILPAARSRDLAASTDSVASFIGELTTFYSGHYRRTYGIDGSCLHDPLTVAVLLDPSLVTCRELFLRIECAGQSTRGRTVADLWRIPQPWGEPNATVALEVDGERAVALIDRVLFGT
jgi:inosine-uridine nucleoside N-ribohydrolase